MLYTYSAGKLMVAEMLILTYLFFFFSLQTQCCFICYRKIRLLQTCKLILWDPHALTNSDKNKSSNLWPVDSGSVLLKHYCLLMGSRYQAHSIFITYKWYKAYFIIYLLRSHVVFRLSEYPGNFWSVRQKGRLSAPLSSPVFTEIHQSPSWVWGCWLAAGRKPLTP